MWPSPTFLYQSQRCGRCGQAYVPALHIGQWMCRTHPGSPNDAQRWSCCGLPLAVSTGLWPRPPGVLSADVRGCTRCDHGAPLPGAHALVPALLVTQRLLLAPCAAAQAQTQTWTVQTLPPNVNAVTREAALALAVHVLESPLVASVLTVPERVRLAARERRVQLREKLAVQPWQTRVPRAVATAARRAGPAASSDDEEEDPHLWCVSLPPPSWVPLEVRATWTPPDTRAAWAALEARDVDVTLWHVPRQASAPEAATLKALEAAGWTLLPS